MTKTKRVLTATAVTAAATAIALVPATAQAHHAQHSRLEELTSVLGQATFTQLSTHDQVRIDAQGILDDGNGTVQIRNDNGTASGKVVCVTGSQATNGFTDAAIGLHINRSTIDGLRRGSDVIEYVRDGGRDNPDYSGLADGGAVCPDAGFTVPDGVLVQVPDTSDDNNTGNGGFTGRNPWNDGRWNDDGRGDRFDRGHRNRHHGNHHSRDLTGFQVNIRG
jgi:hypothetical protein